VNFCAENEENYNHINISQPVDRKKEKAEKEKKKEERRKRQTEDGK
jgi:hypothetical protein